MMTYFLIGAVGYFLFRYRLNIAGTVRRIFMLNEERKVQKKLRTHVEYFDVEEIWPDGVPVEEKKAS